ncbi:MAG: ParB/RepB/Spo0J family partition protein [Planctomycetales bacterium]
MSRHEIIEVPLENLHDNPLQGDYFGTPEDEEIKPLADDIHERGLQHPVEVVPHPELDGVYVIVAGHKRCAALRELGHETAPVIVRADLQKAGNEAIEHHLISDNFHRHNLTQLERARCELRLVEIEAGESLENLSGGRRGKVLEKVAAQLNCSRKTVTRLINVMYAPTVVQEAFNRGQVGIDPASRVHALSEDTREEIVAAIEAGEAPKQVLDRFLSSNSTPLRVLKAKTLALISLDSKLDYLLENSDHLNSDAERLGAMIEKMQRLQGLIRVNEQARRE